MFKIRTNVFHHKKYLYTSSLRQNYSVELELHIRCFYPFFKHWWLLKIIFKSINNNLPYYSILKYPVYYTNHFHQWGCRKTILSIHNQVFMCIHTDSRFPICSDYYKTVIKLHGILVTWSYLPFTTAGGKAAAVEMSGAYVLLFKRTKRKPSVNLHWEHICTLQKINVSNLIYVLKISVHRFFRQKHESV